jgi:hypothetical protein
MQRHQRPNRRPTGIRQPERTIEQLEPRHALAVNFAESPLKAPAQLSQQK